MSECDPEASIMRRPWPTTGCCAKTILSPADPGGSAVQGRLTAGIAGSNPAEGIDVRPSLCSLCVA